MKKATLLLADKSSFEGFAFGADKPTAGEVVFATGMAGYEQSLTDPSYAGQILVFTYPLIGNWGVPKKEYWESQKIQVQGVIVSDLATKPNHHLMQKTLDSWLKDENIPGIFGIDTRKLTQKLRDRGVMLGKIVVDNKDIDFWDPNSENLVAKVSPQEVKIHRPKWEVRGGRIENDVGSEKNLTSHIKNPVSNFSHRTSPIIALLNCGAKKNILRNLLARGATVYDLPWDYDPFAKNLSIDGLVISNGPGDPKMAKDSIAIIKKALTKKIPTFGICLGNQLLALAAGGDTYKLKFGHRAQNQPTIEIVDPERSRRVESKRCYITTQNHGYTVDEKKLPKEFKRWFYNANDNTNEGLIHEKLPFFWVQFHPEATPGPYDTTWLFDYFLEKFR